MQQRAAPKPIQVQNDARLLLHKIAGNAVGLDLEMPIATGEKRRRIYLDSTASTLRLGVVQDALDHYQPYYANTHSTVHFGARLSTEEYRWAHGMVLDFVNACRTNYTAFFVGSGATGGMNRVAATLARRLPERDVVITSIMEHHSNDLPHRKHFKTVVHVPPESGSTSMGCVCVKAIERALEANKGRVAYIAVTGVSNVTGIINPVHEIAALAHAHGALMVVDAAQMVAHVPIRMSGNADPAEDIDVVVFSGHKIYAPGSPGVVVARRELFEGQEPVEVGGGMVDDVWLDRYTPTAALPDREEAGTPNITGAIGLGAALYALHKIGMDVVEEDEAALMRLALQRLCAIPGLALYGDCDMERYPRAGAISFNVRGMHHALTAAILNDYYNIAVRNQCFCAHPYVREMVTEALAAADEALTAAELEALAEMQRGMVRASFGIYTTEGDIDTLAKALEDITNNREHYEALYTQLPNGDYQHKTFRFEPRQFFSVRDAVDGWMTKA
jgi:cysteine desulfurase/selenocysteine lyase